MPGEVFDGSSKSEAGGSSNEWTAWVRAGPVMGGPLSCTVVPVDEDVGGGQLITFPIHVFSFPCRVCPQQFEQKWRLKRHVKSSEERRAYFVAHPDEDYVLGKGESTVNAYYLPTRHAFTASKAKAANVTRWQNKKPTTESIPLKEKEKPKELEERAKIGQRREAAKTKFEKPNKRQKRDNGTSSAD